MNWQAILLYALMSKDCDGKVIMLWIRDNPEEAKYEMKQRYKDNIKNMKSADQYSTLSNTTAVVNIPNVIWGWTTTEIEYTINEIDAEIGSTCDIVLFE